MADARRAVTDCVTTHLGDTPTKHVLVAVSGGADSLALGWAAAFALPRLGHTVEAVIIDHQLQEGSAETAATARDTLTGFGLDTTIISVDVAKGGSIEENARTARYDALEHRAKQRGAVAVLLGHTKNDQAETVLLGLNRGSGPASIRGMAEKRGLWLRPFLGLTRETTQQVCLDAGFGWWEDPHNTDPRFLRPRIRHELMPLLESVLGPGVVSALTTTARLIAEDDDYLSERAREMYEKILTQRGDLHVAGLLEIPAALRRRVVRIWVAEELGVAMTFRQTEMVDALIVSWRGQGPVDVGGGKLVRQDGVITAARPTVTD
jgi:tRNA(Ile)-lysidine synthase